MRSGEIDLCVVSIEVVLEAMGGFQVAQRGNRRGQMTEPWVTSTERGAEEIVLYVMLKLK